MVAETSIFPAAHLLRQIMLRPNPIDHPNFTGSNPAMDFNKNALPPNQGWQLSMVMGPWDVDNDGDGTPDSVWVDFGYPVQATADGKLFKPLVAVLCLDMDGRLNINAHGTTEQADDYSDRFNYLSGAGPYAGAGGGVPVPLMHGEGDGPAEIDLSQYFSSGVAELVAGDPITFALTPANQQQILAAQLVNKLLRGYVPQNVPPNDLRNDLLRKLLDPNDTTSLPGRYTGNGEPLGTTSGTTSEASQPGSNSNNKLAFLLHYQWSDNLKVAPLTDFGSPGDLWGRMTVGLDLRGQPLFWKPRWDHELVSNPYGLNLSQHGAVSYYDDPFTTFELERLCRTNDVDSASLPDRLWRLTDLDLISEANGGLAMHAARTLTTDSWDLPSPNIAVPPSCAKIGNSCNCLSPRRTRCCRQWFDPIFRSWR